MASDLLMVLKNLNEQLRRLNRSVNIVSTRHLQSMSIAVECITLNLKLRMTMQRWEVYLPFHEYRDVEFNKWLRKLTEIHRGMNSNKPTQAAAETDGYYPDYPFCLDMYEMLQREAVEEDHATFLPSYAPRYAESELQADVREYVERVDKNIEELLTITEDGIWNLHNSIDRQVMQFLRRQYADYLRMIFRNTKTAHEIETEVLPEVKCYLAAITGQTTMDYCLDMALNSLIDTIAQIANFFNQEQTAMQYLRLSLRLYYRHCPDAQETAAADVCRWMSEWPSRRRRQRAMEKRDLLVDQLRRQYDTLGIADYIDIERPTPLADSEFGHFLFAHRLKLETDDIRSIFCNCFLIQELNKRIDPETAEADLTVARLDQQRKQIYQRLCELVRMADWQGGMTAERVQYSLTTLLLKPGCDQDAAGEVFWQLLTGRRNCHDGFRSLKLTWLNLVGYFRSRGYLKGKSPALCRSFFPDGTLEGEGNDTDYNAISKGGRDIAGNDVHELITALDKILTNS